MTILIMTIFVLKVYFSLSEKFLSKKGKCYRIYNVIFVALLRTSIILLKSKLKFGFKDRREEITHTQVYLKG